MGDDWVSAKPAELLGYTQQALDIDAELWGQATRLREALDAFRRSRPDGKYISSIPALDHNLQELATQARKIDDWVGRVGEAFRDAGGSGIFGDTQVQTVGVGVIDLLVGGQEQDLQRDRRAYAGRDAEAFRTAVEDHDTDALAALRAKLAANQYDPTYAAAFFEALGPDATLGLAAELHGDQPTLKVFDEALGAATRSPAWHGAFDDELLPGDSFVDVPEYGPVPRTDALRPLLSYGVFSTNFLTQTLDRTVMPDPDSSTYVVPGSDLPRIEMEALARNPDAAARYLSSQFQGNPRVSMLGGLAPTIPGYGKAFGDAIAAAGSAPDTDRADKLGMLKALGQMDWDSEAALPDEARFGVSSAVAANIDLLAKTPVGRLPDQDAGKLGWMEELFVMAELHPDGTLDQARMRQVLGAMHGWVGAHLPAASLRTVGAPDETTRDHELGSFYALALLPISKGIYERSDDDPINKLLQGGNDLLTVVGIALIGVTIPETLGASLAVGGAVYGKVSSAVMDYRAKHADLHAAESSDHATNQAEQTMRTHLATAQVLRNPSLLPGDPDDPHSLAHLASANPLDPRVVRRIDLISRYDLHDDEVDPPMTAGERALHAQLDSVELGVKEQYETSHPELYD
ncbi:MAG TPA: hypothetical protein VFA92_06670 [Candidatus Binatia bacterium]|jgi:hypothetical protein|nr:hypothetical protein [Candidatus Binatia bacterium]